MTTAQYLDVDFSGSHAECEQPGPSNLANLTTWLRQHNLKCVVLHLERDASSFDSERLWENLVGVCILSNACTPIASSCRCGQQRQLPRRKPWTSPFTLTA